LKKASLLHDYLEKYAAGHPWQLEAASLENIAQVVVIPALAEKKHIFDTLASLAANASEMLDTTLVLCVVNNKADAKQEHRADNAETLALLRALMEKKAPALQAASVAQMEMIASSRLRLSVVDASSAGLEIPARAGGVGMARKIGMDTVLRLPAPKGDGPRLILNLDADTLVAADYLEAVRGAFASRRVHAGVVAYKHQPSDDPAEHEAIILYEIYLRSWVAGLAYARSPYAFHSIGSTMAASVEGYLAVRGMNRRAAGEDFYFLNKLAKTGPIKQIRETVVYPSARVSARVPFGTGAAVSRLASTENSPQIFYDARVFSVVKQWLALVAESAHKPADEIIREAERIDATLASFLTARGFVAAWTKVSANAASEQVLLKNFHHWFDGFETLKLINFLSCESFPRTGWRQALKEMFASGDTKFGAQCGVVEYPSLRDPAAALAYLRRLT
jgi:hypothetical protein